jgi:hypothetical protein
MFLCVLFVLLIKCTREFNAGLSLFGREHQVFGKSGEKFGGKGYNFINFGKIIPYVA